MKKPIVKFILINNRKEDYLMKPWHNFVAQSKLELIVINNKDKISDLEPNICYMLYNVEITEETREIAKIIHEKYFVISYPKGILINTHNDPHLNQYSISSISKEKIKNLLLEKTIENIIEYPCLFSIPASCLARGKFLLKNETELKMAIENSEHLRYEIKEYIKHDFIIRVYIINQEFSYAVFTHKDETEFATNRMPIPKKRLSVKHNIDKTIIKIATYYAKLNNIQTAGIDILCSQEGKYYILELNFPMSFTVRTPPDKVYTQIITGLLTHAQKCLKWKEYLKTKSNPTLLVKDWVKNQPWHPQLNWLTKEGNINVDYVSEEKTHSHINKDKIYLSLNYFNNLAASNNIYNVCNKNTLNKNIFEKCQAPFWPEYNINKEDPIVSNDIPTTLPAILIAYKNNRREILKINDMQDMLAKIHFFYHNGFKISIKPFIYVSQRRKVILVGDNIICAKEYMRNIHDCTDVFYTEKSFYLQEEDISSQEKEVFHSFYIYGQRDCAWTYEYIIDIKNDIYTQKFYNFPDFNQFVNMTSEPIVAKTIYSLYKQYHSGQIKSSAQKAISS